METSDPASPEGGVAFLLVQLGFHLARVFGERLEPLGLEQRQAGMLARLAENDGGSQQAIAELLGVNPTRMVFLTDELEKLGLVERRRNPADRRSHALYLTEAGTAMLARVREVTRAHEAAATAGLSAPRSGISSSHCSSISPATRASPRRLCPVRPRGTGRGLETLLRAAGERISVAVVPGQRPRATASPVPAPR